MKKFRVLVMIVALMLLFSLSGCSFGANGRNKQFGAFSYNGVSLVEYAVKQITAQQAKEIVPLANSMPIASASVGTYSIRNQTTPEDNTLPNEVIKAILTNYSGCCITTKYYLENDDQLQSKTDKIVGTDFKNLLEQNQFAPFNQLVAKNIVVYDELIDYMEEENQLFQDSTSGLIAPFRTIFSYHTGEDGNLIIQTRDFAEIASSVGGGVGCSYRQDTEIVYDMEGKMILWQTSLGISTSAPQGTMRQGYILEMSVEWLDKI